MLDFTAYDQENNPDLFEHYNPVALLLASAIFTEDMKQLNEMKLGEKYRIRIEKLES